MKVCIQGTYLDIIIAIYDKGLISKIYKQLNKNKNKQQQQKHNQNMGRRHKQTFLQRRHTDGQQAHENILSIANYLLKANQNYDEVPPHTGQNSHH